VEGQSMMMFLKGGVAPQYRMGEWSERGK